MTFIPYTISEKKEITENTYMFMLRKQNTDAIPSFLPGQYVFLKNPQFLDPDEEHPFSIASSPLQKNYLEFCIKVYGDWTNEVMKLNKGDILFVSEPQGNFTWPDNTKHAVFLLGGIGISPIMSILRTLVIEKKHPEITLLYGNRTPDTITYKNELEEIAREIGSCKIVHIFSHISENHPWRGYRGFITKDIIEKEVNKTNQPIFFVIGPPIFIQKIDAILAEMSIPQTQIKKEQLEKKK